MWDQEYEKKVQSLFLQPQCIYIFTYSAYAITECFIIPWIFSPIYAIKQSRHVHVLMYIFGLIFEIQDIEGSLAPPPQENDEKNANEEGLCFI